MNQTITIYHSPDADDAFMFYGMSCGAAKSPRYHFQHELKDIESLNHLALQGSLEVTAVSVHAYAYLQDRYAILSCGASMGGAEYGPRLVAKAPYEILDPSIKVIAVPGTFTSAFLALRLFAKERDCSWEFRPMHFDEIMDAVKAGEVDAGLIIHEGQITHARQGFSQILDLGAWWWKKHALPLPLGVNVVRRDLGTQAANAVYEVLKGSIKYGLQHREAALGYALTFGRGISREEADRFVAMYVNEWTLDLGEAGRRSIRVFLEEASKASLLDAAPVPTSKIDITFVQ